MLHRTAAVAIAFAGTTAAMADISLLNEQRTIGLAALGSSDFDGFQDQFFDKGSGANDDPFAPWSSGASISATGAQSAVGFATGDVLADIDVSGFTFAGSLDTSAAITDATGSSAEGSGQLLMVVGFMIDEDQLWRLDASSVGDATIRLESPDLFTPVFDLGAGDFDQEYLLGAGTYTFTVSLSASSVLFGLGNATDSSAIGVTFVVVPAVPTLGLLGAGVVVAGRRRRG